jgi:hypothetical protein
MRLVQELTMHQLITVTNVSNSERDHCANYCQEANSTSSASTTK